MKRRIGDLPMGRMFVTLLTGKFGQVTRAHKHEPTVEFFNKEDGETYEVKTIHGDVKVDDFEEEEESRG